MLTKFILSPISLKLVNPLELHQEYRSLNSSELLICSTISLNSRFPSIMVPSGKKTCKEPLMKVSYPQPSLPFKLIISTELLSKNFLIEDLLELCGLRDNSQDMMLMEITKFLLTNLTPSLITLDLINLFLN